jgi:hypothetical protein
VTTATRALRQGEHDTRGRQSIIWPILALLLIFWLLTLPFYIPITLTVGERLLMVRPLTAKAGRSAPGRSWDVSFHQFSGSILRVADDNGEHFLYQGPARLHVVRLAGSGFSYIYGHGKKAQKGRWSLPLG